jgi:alpha/beta superfamily hydrolase
MLVQQKFSIAGATGFLEGIAHLPDVTPRAIAVVAHPLPTMGGTMENKVATTLAKTFVELDFVALRFNFRGVGGSEGKFDDGNGEVEDVLAVVSYARQEYNDLPLILSGFSFGGYVQACAAQQLHPQQLVLVAPAVGRFAMPSVPHNTLLIHGEQDEVVPLADVLNWARPQQLPIVVLPGAEHFFHGRLNQIKQIVLQHFTGLSL